MQTVPSIQGCRRKGSSNSDSAQGFGIQGMRLSEGNDREKEGNKRQNRENILAYLGRNDADINNTEM